MDDREVIVICTVKKSIPIPDDLNNEDEVRDYLRRSYDDSELVKYPDEVIIEEIENCPNDEEDIDKYVDEWIMKKE